MNVMKMNPLVGCSAGKLLRIAVLAFALTLTACGGGSGSDDSSSVITTIQRLVATGNPDDFQAAMDLFLANMDTFSVSDFQAAMDALIGAA